MPKLADAITHSHCMRTQTNNLQIQTAPTRNRDLGRPWCINETLESHQHFAKHSRTFIESESQFAKTSFELRMAQSFTKWSYRWNQQCWSGHRRSEQGDQATSVKPVNKRSLSNSSINAWFGAKTRRADSRANFPEINSKNLSPVRQVRLANQQKPIIKDTGANYYFQ